MAYGMEDRAVSLSYLAAYFYAACGLPLWCYTGEGELLYTTSSYSQEFGTFLELNGCKDFLLAHHDEVERPVVLSDALGLIWVGECLELPNLPGSFVLMGPMFNSETSAKTIEQRLLDSDLSLTVRSIGRRVLGQVPVLSVPMMQQYIRMLHFAVSGSLLPADSILYQNTESVNTLEQALEEKPREKSFHDYERAWSVEQELMSCIRDGNLGYRSVLEQERRRALPDDFQTGDPLRDAKNTLLVFISKCARAAIEGKLPIKTARQMELDYSRRLEQCATLTEIASLRKEVLDGFAHQVHALKEMPGVSQPILRCCDYVKAHFMEPLELEDIAKAVGYTEYYLTRKFQKEMGQRLSDYIRHVRLEYAKIWLISTEKSIQEISELLQFGSRNYFSRAFKEDEGVSPQEFRSRARMIRTD